MNSRNPSVCWHWISIVVCLAFLSGCNSGSRLFGASGYGATDAYDARIVLLTKGIDRPVEIMLDDTRVGTVHQDEIVGLGVEPGSYLVRSTQVSSFPASIVLTRGEVANIVITDNPKGLFFQAVTDQEFSDLRAGKYLTDALSR